MRIVDPQVELVKTHGYSLEGIKKDIEEAGRTSYASSDKITDTSYEKFFEMIKKNAHLSVMEFGTVYLQVPKGVVELYISKGNPFTTLLHNPYTFWIKAGEDYSFTTNMRVINENKLEEVLEYLCEPTIFHLKRYTFRFILSRGIADEFARHRALSMCMQSTRYCNYSKDKFNNEVTFVNSQELPLKTGVYALLEDGSIVCGNSKLKDDTSGELVLSYIISEHEYFRLLEKGVKPQIARDVLPLGLKTELIMTGTTEQWRGFLNLRCASDAHPDARYLANKVKEILNL